MGRVGAFGQRAHRGAATAVVLGAVVAFGAPRAAASTTAQPPCLVQCGSNQLLTCPTHLIDAVCQLVNSPPVPSLPPVETPTPLATPTATATPSPRGTPTPRPTSTPTAAPSGTPVPPGHTGAPPSFPAGLGNDGRIGLGPKSGAASHSGSPHLGFGPPPVIPALSPIAGLSFSGAPFLWPLLVGLDLLGLASVVMVLRRSWSTAAAAG